MMDYFLPHSKVFCRNIKSKKKGENLNYLLVGFTLFPSSPMFLSGIKMGGSIVCTLLLTGKHDWSIS